MLSRYDFEVGGDTSRLDVVNDQRGCPTYTVDLARALIQLCRKNASGIVHATTRATAPGLSLRKRLCAARDFRRMVRPVSSRTNGTACASARLFRFVAGSSASLGIEMPSWRDALRRYLKQRLSRSSYRRLPLLRPALLGLPGARLGNLVKLIQNYIDGRFVSGKKEFADVNPADGTTIAQVTEADQEQVNAGRRRGSTGLERRVGPHRSPRACGAFAQGCRCH